LSTPTQIWRHSSAAGPDRSGRASARGCLAVLRVRGGKISRRVLDVSGEPRGGHV